MLTWLADFFGVFWSLMLLAVWVLAVLLAVRARRHRAAAAQLAEQMKASARRAETAVRGDAS